MWSRGVEDSCGKVSLIWPNLSLRHSCDVILIDAEVIWLSVNCSSLTWIYLNLNHNLIFVLLIYRVKRLKPVLKKIWLRSLGVNSRMAMCIRLYILLLFFQLQWGVFIVLVVIVRILESELWTYLSCRCYTELVVQDGSYKCFKCGLVMHKMQRTYPWCYILQYTWLY